MYVGLSELHNATDTVFHHPVSNWSGHRSGRSDNCNARKAAPAP